MGVFVRMSMALPLRMRVRMHVLAVRVDIGIEAATAIFTHKQLAFLSNLKLGT